HGPQETPRDRSALEVQPRELRSRSRARCREAYPRKDPRAFAARGGPRCSTYRQILGATAPSRALAPRDAALIVPIHWGRTATARFPPPSPAAAPTRQR